MKTLYDKVCIDKAIYKMQDEKYYDTNKGTYLGSYIKSKTDPFISDVFLEVKSRENLPDNCLAQHRSVCLFDAGSCKKCSH